MTQHEHYKITGTIGGGGMCTVYEAEDSSLHRRVALKVLNVQLSRLPVVYKRFQVGARLMAGFDHPNITRVINLYEHEGQPALVMEYLEGEDLNEKIRKEGALKPEIIRSILFQVLNALDYIHSRHVIHRDIKPGNIFVLKDGTVKLLDFDNAADLSGRWTEQENFYEDQPGTLMYMSPEHLTRESPLDQRSDLYSLGVTLYGMLTGSPLYDENDSHFVTSNKVVFEPIPEITMQAEWNQLLKKVCHKAPDHRFQSAKEWLDALVSWPPAAYISDSEEDAKPDLERTLILGQPSTGNPEQSKLTPDLSEDSDSSNAQGHSSGGFSSNFEINSKVSVPEDTVVNDHSDDTVVNNQRNPEDTVVNDHSDDTVVNNQRNPEDTVVNDHSDDTIVNNQRNLEDTVVNDHSDAPSIPIHPGENETGERGSSLGEGTKPPVTLIVIASGTVLLVILLGLFIWRANRSPSKKTAGVVSPETETVEITEIGLESDSTVEIPIFEEPEQPNSNQRTTEKKTKSIPLVYIGNQKWLGTNQDNFRFRNGASIKEARTNFEWVQAGRNREPAWCYYNNDPSMGQLYGKLYNWYAVIDARGLCPLGWRVPTEDDWNTIAKDLGGEEQAGGKLKSTEGWNVENRGATDQIQFGALPGGSRDIYGNFKSQGTNGLWWTASSINNEQASARYLYYMGWALNRGNDKKENGFSVRCVSP